MEMPIKQINFSEKDMELTGFIPHFNNITEDMEDDKVLNIDLFGEDKLIFAASKYGVEVETLNSDKNVGFTTLLNKKDIDALIIFLQESLKTFPIK